MSFTRLQIVNQAAKRLGILANGQTLPSEDYNDIDALWPPLAAELEARQIFVVQDLAEVQDAEFLHLADLLAIKAAPTFGLSAEALAARGVSKRTSEDELEMIGSSSPTQKVLTIERFW